MYKILTRFVACNSPAVRQSRSCVIILAYKSCSTEIVYCSAHLKITLFVCHKNLHRWKVFFFIKSLSLAVLETDFFMSYYNFFIWCKIFIFNPGWKRCLWMPHALQYERQKWDEWSLLSGKTIILPFLTLFAAACTVNQNREFHLEIQNVFCILYDYFWNIKLKYVHTRLG